MALAVVAVVAVVAVATFVWWRHWGPGHHSVAVLGDSITFFSAEALESGLGFRYDVTLNGQSGARLDERVDAAQELAATRPQNAVINLGSNDVLQARNLEASIAALQRIGAAFAGSSCIAVTTVNENMAEPGDSGLHDRAVAFNAQLRAVAAQHGWRIIDWAGTVASYEQSGAPDGPISDDTIHPNDRGQQLLVAATYDVLATC
jgi:lysophospholipase L1-like esterase